MDSGYRLFSQRHNDQIRFIKRAQKLGFTLSEIGDLLNLKMDEETNCSELNEVFEYIQGSVFLDQHKGGT